MTVPVLMGISLIIFTVMSLSPGSPARLFLGERAEESAVHELNEKLGFNDPFMIKYLRYMSRAARGDFGLSYKTKLPVVKEILTRFPTTAKLALLAMLISSALSIPLGVLCAIKQYSAFDSAIMVLALIFVAMPAFWLGLLLILLFSLHLGWLPVAGAESWRHFILPAATLALVNVAVDLRMTRSTMLEVIRQDYIRTARAKGVPERRIIVRHALRNAMMPVVTSIGINLGMLLGGTIVTEAVFGMPGLGSLLLSSIRMKDIPMVMGCVLFLSFTFSLVTLAVDLSYGFFDPRIRVAYGRKP
jgi:peptide/nickel transport system permease protein